MRYDVLLYYLPAAVGFVLVGMAAGGFFRRKNPIVIIGILLAVTGAVLGYVEVFDVTFLECVIAAAVCGVFNVLGTAQIFSGVCCNTQIDAL